MILAQTLPKLVTDNGQSTPIGILLLMLVVLGVGAIVAYDRWLSVQLNKKRLAEPAPTNHRELAQPLEVKQADVYVRVPEFNEKLVAMKTEMDGKFAHTEEVFRTRFHKLDEDLNDIKIAAQNGRDTATEQFKDIEGQIGGLKSTADHTNALAIRTDQAVRALASELPKQIADALHNRRRT